MKTYKIFVFKETYFKDKVELFWKKMSYPRSEIKRYSIKSGTLEVADGNETWLDYGEPLAPFR